MRKTSVLTIAILFVIFMVLPILAPEKAAAASKFANGEYSVPFTVLKDTTDEQSTTVDYMISPAKVIIQNDKTYVVVTLKNSSWWQYFKVQSGSRFADVQVLSNDTVNDQRVVKFEVKDIEQLVDAKIHIIVTGIPNFEYDNKYDIRFKFTSSGIPLAPVAEKPTATPAPKSSGSEKTAATPSPKTSENKTEKKQDTAAKAEEKKQESKDLTKEEEKKLEAESTDTSENDVAVTMDTEESDFKEPVVVLSKDIEELAGEESTEIMEEVVEKTEVAADTASKSSIGRTMFVIFLSVLVLGGVYLLFIRKPSQSQK